MPLKESRNGGVILSRDRRLICSCLRVRKPRLYDREQGASGLGAAFDTFAKETKQQGLQCTYFARYLAVAHRYVGFEETL